MEGPQGCSPTLKEETMLKRIVAVIWSLATLLAPAKAQHGIDTAARVSISLNGTWQYVLNQPQNPIPTSGWTATRVPALPVDDGTASVWYKLDFTVPSTWNQSGRRFFVTVHKAGHYAAVYFNGNFIYDHFGQFSPFQAEVTNQIIFGQNNEIEIYVHKADTVYVRRGADIDQSSRPSDNPGCIGNAYRSSTNTDQERNWVGLAGDITLSWTPNSYISDTEVVTSVRNSTITAYVTAPGSGTLYADAEVLDGSTVVLSLAPQAVTAGVAILQASWPNPVLWGPPPYGQPKLYTLRTRLQQNGVRIDTTYSRFGFREVWVSGTEVLLNGQRLWMVGDYTSKLAPIRTVNDRRPQAFGLYIMEQSGFNTLQSHWDDPGQSWLDLADEMGMLVIASYFCDGRPAGQSQIDSVNDWTQWEIGTATEWALARRNHASLVIWRPMDKLPPGGASEESTFPQIAAAIRAIDHNNRPFADGSDIDFWAQGVEDGRTGNCATDTQFVQKLQSETKPLLTKELYDGLALQCAPGFFSQYYADSFTLGSVGLVIQYMELFNYEEFTPSWFSISGIGNRPVTLPVEPDGMLPNWLTLEWVPTQYSTQFGGLWQTYWQPTLFSSSPTSGDYQASGIPSGVQFVFLVASPGSGDPVGVLAADDGSGTAWFVVPAPGNYSLTYTVGDQTVSHTVTVTAPPPF
jgi:beta-glucuronidase